MIWNGGSLLSKQERRKWTTAPGWADFGSDDHPISRDNSCSMESWDDTSQVVSCRLGETLPAMAAIRLWLSLLRSYSACRDEEVEVIIRML